MTARRTLLLSMLLLGIAGMGPAGAANLQISPVTITMRAEQSSAGITLQNLGDAPLFGQVRVFLWDQANGEEALTPTQELVASPPIVEIAANSRQTIRLVRTQAGPAPQERTYRVLIDEVARDDDPARSGVDIRLRYSVPVFVQPAGAPASPPALQWALQREGDKTLLQVSNSGGTHAQLADLVFIDAAGQRTQVAPGLLGYVLPGARMRWALKLPAAALASGGRWEAMINGTTDTGIPLAAPAR